MTYEVIIDKELAEKIVNHTLKYTLRPKKGDRAILIAEVINIIVDELHYCFNPEQISKQQLLDLMDVMYKYAFVDEVENKK